MTKLLERAIREVQKLPSSEQDSIASLILDELADERQWEETFLRNWKSSRPKPGRIFEPASSKKWEWMSWQIVSDE